MNDPMDLLIANAARLRGVSKRPLPALAGNDYLRPVPGGCTILSVNPACRPQQGITRSWRSSGDTDLAGWIAARDAAFVRRKNRRTRETPEKALQSFLIRDAIAHGGRMSAFAAAFADPPELRFLMDEFAFVLAGTTNKVVCDLIAVRRQGDMYIPVAIELKSSRLLDELKRQVRDAANMVEANRAAMERLAEASWGERITFCERAERWIVYPADRAGHRGCDDAHADACAAEGIRLITYAEPTKHVYTLHSDA